MLALVGAVAALPVDAVADRCPAAGEGQNYCVLQKAWLPAVMQVLLFGLAGLVATELALSAAPRWAAYKRERARRRLAAPPPFVSDRTLVEASWEHTYEDSARPRPRRRAAPAEPLRGTPEPDEIEMRR